MATGILSSREIGVVLDFLKEKVEGVLRIGVTGSYADNTETLKSDLDIVVDIRRDCVEEFRRVADEVKSFLIDDFMLPVDFILFHDIERKLEKEMVCACDKAEAELYYGMLSKVVWRNCEVSTSLNSNLKWSASTKGELPMGTDLYRKNRLVASFDAQGILTFIDEKNVPQIVKRTRSLEAFKLQRESDVTRTNMRYLRKLMGISSRNTRGALDKINGFSLFDTFWYQDQGGDLTWGQICLKKNDAFEVALTGREKDVSVFDDPRTPEHSNIGSYEKGWKPANGSWQLYKVGTPEQLWSEIFATRLLALKGVNVVRYWLDGSWVVCDNFVDQANDVCLEHYNSYGSEDTEESTVLQLPFLSDKNKRDLEIMYYCDALLMNFDRHDFNFGFLTQEDSCELSPLFDWNLCLFGHKYPDSFTRSLDPLIRGVLDAKIEPPFILTREEILDVYNAVQNETGLVINASGEQVARYLLSSQALLLAKHEVAENTPSNEFQKSR